MDKSPTHFLQEALSGTELPDGLAFVHPDDPASPQEEAALQEFLQDFAASLDDDEDLGLKAGD